MAMVTSRQLRNSDNRNNKDVIAFFFIDPLLLELRERYPENKPICLNYATVRQDIFGLYDEVTNLRNKVSRLENPIRKLKIGRWSISVRKDVEVHDQKRFNQVFGKRTV